MCGGAKDSEGPCTGIENLKPVACLQIDWLLVHVAAELILLPHLRIVAPLEFGVRLDCEALEAAFVDVGHVRRVGFGQRILAQKVGAFVCGELEVSGKEAEGESVEDHAHVVAIALYLAGIGVVANRGALDFIGRASWANEMRIMAGNLKRCIPKYVPLILVFSLGSVVVQALQDVEFSGGDAAAPSGHLKIRSEIGAEDDPRAVGLFRSEFGDDRLTIAESKPRAILLALLARPQHFNRIVAGRHAYACDGLQIFEVATLRLCDGGKSTKNQYRRDATDSHLGSSVFCLRVIDGRDFVSAAFSRAH